MLLVFQKSWLLGLNVIGVSEVFTMYNIGAESLTFGAVWAPAPRIVELNRYHTSSKSPPGASNVVPFGVCIAAWLGYRV